MSSNEFKCIYKGVECYAVWVDESRPTVAKVHYGNGWEGIVTATSCEIELL